MVLFNGSFILYPCNHHHPFVSTDYHLLEFRFTQLLDHSTARTSNNNNNAASTWQQRFVVADGYFKPGGAVFLFLAGEAPMEFFEFQEVSALTWAQQNNALYVKLEHRYYGQSWPTAGDTASLQKYANSVQALADAAYFLQQYNATIAAPHGPWVVLGCSYSGALSSWFRQLYPELVVASVAPSGPVLALTNFTGYLELFPKSAGARCAHLLERGVQQALTMLKGGQADELSDIFGACAPLQQKDFYFFEYTVENVVGSADQMSNPPDWTLVKTCNIVEQAHKKGLPPVQQLAAAFQYQVQIGASDSVKHIPPSSKSQGAKLSQMILKHLSSEEGGASGSCNDFSESNFILSLQNTTPSSDNLMRIWTWQTCIEFGFFSGSYGPPPKNMWFPGVDVDHQVRWCQQIYGVPNLAPDTKATNARYGGMNPAVTSVIYTNGVKDPWHLLSILKPKPGSWETAVYDAGHCATMIQPTDADPPSLTAARQHVATFLQTAINNASQKK